MNDKEKEAIEIVKNFTKINFSNPLGWTGYYDTELKELNNAAQILLNLIEKQQKEIDKRDKMIDYLCKCFFDKFPAELILEYNINDKKELIKHFEEVENE